MNVTGNRSNFFKKPNYDRPKNYFNSSHHNNSHAHHQGHFGKFGGQGSPIKDPGAPALSSELYPSVPPSTALTVVPSAASTTNGSSSVVTPPGSGSGQLSGSGSSAAGTSSTNTPVPSSTATLTVDNWNLDSMTISSDVKGGTVNRQGTGRNLEHTVFVGSLDYNVTSDILEQTFKSRYPSVCSGKVILEETTGQSKGFGFVRFASQAEYKAALAECAGQPLFGGNRGIRVAEAHPKPPRSNYAGSITSGDMGGYPFQPRGNPRMPAYGHRAPSDIGMSNGLVHGGKGKGGPRYSNAGDNNTTAFDHQKKLDQKRAIEQVRNWYPGGNQGNNQRPAGFNVQSPPHQNQHGHQQFPGISEVTGAPIMIQAEGCAPFPYWAPAANGAFGQVFPPGYPNLAMEQFAPQPYWSTGTAPNGQAILIADPNAVYANIDYAAMTGGQVPTPYPRMPYTEQTAHMFQPQAMMQGQGVQAAPSVPTPNNGLGHHPHFMPGPGGDVNSPGGPTPPSDTEHGMIAMSGNGWIPQN